MFLLFTLADEGNGGLAFGHAGDGGQVNTRHLLGLHERAASPNKVAAFFVQAKGPLVGSAAAAELDDASAGLEHGDGRLLSELGLGERRHLWFVVVGRGGELGRAVKGGEGWELEM